MAERAKILQQMGIVDNAAADGNPSGMSASEPVPSASTAKGRGKGKGKASAANGRTPSSSQVNGDVDSHNGERISSSLPRQKNKRARTGSANGDSTSPMTPNGSAPSSANGAAGGMKIKIRPRSSVPAHDRTSGANGTKNGVLPLGPPSHFKTNGGSSENSNGVVFAPPGAAEAPLWTRVPLPPPPSPRTRTSGASTASHAHQSNRSSFSPSNANGNGMDYRSALSPNAPNPGRTIYSRR